MSSALPAKYTFVAWLGATFRKNITLLQGDTGSSPRDLTGFTSVMNLYSAPATTPLYTLTIGNGGVSLGGARGTIFLYIPASTTLTFQSWPSPSAIYELTITDAAGSGDTDSLMWGTFVIEGIA